MPGVSDQWRHPDPGLDTGLLSPVRAGTAVESAVSDEAWIVAMLEAESALARTQARLGVVPADQAEIITNVARTGSFDVAAIARRSRETANPVVALVDALTKAVADVDPAAATYVHRGSTSQDVFDTGLMLVARSALDIILADLDQVVAALTTLATEYRDTAMPGRTLAQHAVPITFGLKAAGWLVGVEQARRRLAAIRVDGLPAQLGGAAGTLAGYVEYARMDGHQIDEYAGALLAGYAAEACLREPVIGWHTNRFVVADLAAALAAVAGALGKIATDVAVLSRTEIGELAEPTGEGRGVSSAMPHKRNPVLSALIRMAATVLPMSAAAVFACLPAEDERPVGLWQAEWQPLRECLRLTGGAAAAAVELLTGLQVFPERMAANLTLVGELVASERVSAVLAPILGRPQARALVTRLCGQAIAEGRKLSDLLIAEAVLPEAEVTALLDPFQYTGVAGLLVDRAITWSRGGEK
jgi:3-carboxy-cis,cis-muconate cycloisomerase